MHVPIIALQCSPSSEAADWIPGFSTSTIGEQAFK